jgi:hypothetical protein
MRFVFFSKKKLPQKDSNLAHLPKKRLKICQLFLINFRVVIWAVGATTLNFL